MNTKADIVLKVEDIHTTINYYQEILGWKTIVIEGLSKMAKIVTNEDTVILATTDIDQDLDQWVAERHVTPISGSRIYFIRSKDLNKERQFLEKKGVTQLEEENEAGCYGTLLIQDPDGYIIEYWKDLDISDDELMKVYEIGPNQLKNVLNGLSDEQLDLQKTQGKWGIRENASHLIRSDLGSMCGLLEAMGEMCESDTWLKNSYNEITLTEKIDLFSRARNVILTRIKENPLLLNNKNGNEDIRFSIKMLAGHAYFHMRRIKEIRIHHDI